jgi:hypothetical protein
MQRGDSPAFLAGLLTLVCCLQQYRESVHFQHANGQKSAQLHSVFIGL